MMSLSLNLIMYLNRANSLYIPFFTVYASVLKVLLNKHKLLRKWQN